MRWTVDAALHRACIRAGEIPTAGRVAVYVWLGALAEEVRLGAGPAFLASDILD